MVLKRTLDIGCLVRSIMASLLLVLPVTKGYAEDLVYTNIDESVNSVMTSIASKKQEYVTDAPGVITVITHDELELFGGTTLSDILKRVPSFLGTTIYMTDRSVIASRGDQVLPSSSHILLLVNGRPMREVMEGGIKSEVYESFPVSVIERIEIIRGPGSVLYGSQAVSAVINIVTKNSKNNSVSISGALGEQNHNYIMADLQYTIGDFGIVAAGRYADKGGWEIDWEAPGLFTTYTNHVTIPDYGPGGYAEVNYKDLRLMGAYNEWTTQYFLPDIQWYRDVDSIGISDVTGRATWRKLFGDLGYKLKPVEWYTTSVNATYTRSWFETTEFPWTYRDAFEVIGEWTNFFTPIKNLNVILGGVVGFMTGIERDANNDTLAYNRGIYNEGHLQYNFSGYSQIDYRWDWCKIIGGIQGNKVRVKDSLGNVDNFKVDFNPRIGLIFYPFESVNIKTLLSTAYRAPSIDELYLDYRTMSGKMIRKNDISWEAGHRYDLEPEKIYTFDMGINCQKKNVRLAINGFYSWMKNLIIQRLITDDDLIWDNVGETNIYGLECEGAYSYNRNIFLQGSFLYQYSKNPVTHEDNVTPLPNFSVKGGVSYKSDFGLVISGFSTFKQELDKKYHATLNTTTKSYTMITLCSKYDFNWLLQYSTIRELSLVCTIDNLLDEKVWLPFWGGTASGSVIPYHSGRTVYGGFKVTF